MTYQIENLSPARRKVAFEVPADRVTTALSKAFKRLQDQVRMPGFRKGKVPRNILEGRFGRSVRSDVAAEFIQAAWKEIQPEVQPIGEPSIEPGDVEFNQPFAFSFTVDVQPEIVISDYRGINLLYPRPTVGDDEVGRRVAQQMEQAARIVEVSDDRAIEKGHIVITELVLLDGEAELVRESGTAIRVGDEKYYTGVDDLLVGMHLGDEKQAEVTIAASSDLDAIKGRTLQANLKVVGLQVSEIPALSDEVAASLGFPDAEGMRGSIREQILHQKEDQVRTVAKGALMDILVKANPFEVPEVLLQQQYNLLVEEAQVLHTYRGRDPRTFSVNAKMRDDFMNRARYSVQASQILTAIANQEGIPLTEEEIEATYQRFADERGQKVEAIKGYFAQDGAEDLLRTRLLEQKVLDWLLTVAVLVDPAEQVATLTAEAVTEAPVEEPAAT